MSVGNLKKASETNWARIDRMTDEDIDTSDSPPLDEAFFSEAKWRLPRSYIYLKDFHQARRFAGYILKQRLHERKKTEQARARQQLVLLAFNTSLIISYSRPFSGNYDSKGHSKSSLQVSERAVLMGEGEIDLHHRVLSLRDRSYAHSDASSHLIEGLDYRKHIALMRSVETLDRPETVTLKLMIGKWIRHLETDTTNLKELVKRRA